MQLRTQHRLLLSTMGCLILIGLLNLLSALHLWGGGLQLRQFWMQLVWLVLGGGLAWLLSWYDYRLLRQSGSLLHGLALALCLLVLLFGREVSGHRSWVAMGGLGIQPSEFIKLTSVLVLARFFTDRPQSRGFRLRDLGWPFFLTGLALGVILLQGDLGTTIFLLLVLGSFLLFAKLHRSTLVILLAVTLIGGGLAYQVLFTQYQQERITTFLHPEADPQGSGYQLLQSKIAVGSGGVWGRGYLRGQVNKLRYLPEKHTDFIFPVLAEEWGFVGCVVTLSLFFILLLLGLEIARSSRDRFGGLLAVGIVFWLFWQIAINLGGVLGLMPMTGVTLPFLSYGGSSMLATFAAMGLLLSVHRRRFLF